MVTSAKLQEKIEGLETRLEEITSEFEDKEAQLEGLRDNLGTAIASAAPAKDRQQLQAQIRTLSDDVDGLRRAVPLLKEAIAGAKEELQKAQRKEAAQEAARRVSSALELLESGAQEFRSFLTEWIPRMEAIEQATREAWEAERFAFNLSGSHMPPASRVMSEGWWAKPGLQQALEASRAYLVGGPAAYQEQERMKRKSAEAPKRTAKAAAS